MTEVTHLNGNGDSTPTPGSIQRFTSGLILPPPEIKGEYHQFSVDEFNVPYSLTAAIDRTALFVARSANPPQLEERVREGQRSDPKFSFLNPADPYHGYYQYRMEKVARGEVEDETVQKEKEGEKDEKMELIDVGVEPPPAEFILELPNISSLDLCVLFVLFLFIESY